jgi:hypothetical protein
MKLCPIHRTSLFLSDGWVRMYLGAHTRFSKTYELVFWGLPPALPTREEMKLRRRISPANSPTCEPRGAGANSLSLFQSLHSDRSTHCPTGTMFLISQPGLHGSLSLCYKRSRVNAQNERGWPSIWSESSGCLLLCWSYIRPSCWPRTVVV